jgi:signal transduction histidine kinase
VIGRIRQLLKKETPAVTSLDLNAIVDEVVDLARPDLANRHVLVETDLAPDLPRVNGDRVQLQQVLLNLIANAAEATASASGGARTVTVRSRRSDNCRAAVSVIDAGPGLDAAVAPRLFDPFFTTKPDGMGMGLAICRRIVSAHGGELTPSNNADSGATFTVTLPPSSSEDGL